MRHVVGDAEFCGIDNIEWNYNHPSSFAPNRHGRLALTRRSARRWRGNCCRQRMARRGWLHASWLARLLASLSCRTVKPRIDERSRASFSIPSGSCNTLPSKLLDQRFDGIRKFLIVIRIQPKTTGEAGWHLLCRVVTNQRNKLDRAWIIP